jgi:AcrR family transcriptional regulator
MMASAGKDPETLRNRLVEAALEILAQDGIEALTLRAVARRVGVSHGAPARHFRSLSDLRAEVAAVGFRLLSEAVEKSNAQIDGDGAPILGLAAGGRAYVETAIRHPGLFALMSRAGDLDLENTSFARDSVAAFAGLLEHVRAAQIAGWKPADDPHLLAGALWSSVHGLATLWTQGAYQNANPKASLDEAIAVTLQLSEPERSGEIH